MNAIYFGPVLLSDEDLLGKRAVSGLFKRGDTDPRHTPLRHRERREADLAELESIAAQALHVATSGWYRSPEDLLLK